MGCVRHIEQAYVVFEPAGENEPGTPVQHVFHQHHPSVRGALEVFHLVDGDVEFGQRFLALAVIVGGQFARLAVCAVVLPPQGIARRGGEYLRFHEFLSSMVQFWLPLVRAVPSLRLQRW